MVGDGYCNDESNNLICDFDGGDCCLLNVITDHCSQCDCKQQACIAGFLPPSVGDGFCNDEMNYADCSYDHGDCCLFDKYTDHCLECSCSSNGVIASPGFPHYYPDNLDLSWLIQLPLGQSIELNFLSFEAGPEFSCK